MALGQRPHLVEVDPLILPAHAVADRLEPLARDVRRRAMGQMAAGGERHAQNGVAGPQQREEHREVRRRAAVRLHVDVGAAEQPLRPVDRELLGDIHEFAAAIVAAPRIALGVLVGEHAALGFEHGGADEVLRRDQLDLALLAPDLAPDRGGDLGIELAEPAVEEILVGVEAGRGLAQGHRTPKDRWMRLSYGRGHRDQAARVATAGQWCGPNGERAVACDVTTGDERDHIDHGESPWRWALI